MVEEGSARRVRPHLEDREGHESLLGAILPRATSLSCTCAAPLYCRGPEIRKCESSNSVPLFQDFWLFGAPYHPDGF